eukprot:COSAG01_NODE_70105_length_259_cov_1.106250_1_plen_35_part_10
MRDEQDKRTDSSAYTVPACDGSRPDTYVEVLLDDQ